MFECQFTLPTNVSIAVICKQNIDGTDVSRTNKFQVTAEFTQLEKFPSQSLTELSRQYSNDMGHLTDLFEQLIDSPEKLKEVCELMVEFVNNNLAEIGQKIHTLHELADGSKLLLLIGIVGRFFIPFNRYHINPASEEQKDKNITLAMKLLDKQLHVDISRLSKQGKHSLQDLLAGEIKSISRAIFLMQQINQ
jgi:uncharacterized protein Yka (UPF0111/DUF47 family)